ncbi:hypothetical protein IWW52_005806, partial [Coemansia sp. RSA 2704]
DLPLALAVDAALPMSAGTRPPPIATEPAEPAEPVRVKLKLKLAAPPAPPAEPEPRPASTLPRISSPLARSPTRIIEYPPEPQPPSEPEPQPLSEPQQRLSADERKLVYRLLRKLRRLPAAVPFLGPVDVVRDGCPTYYDVVKRPMDLGAMKMKLDQRQYASLDDVRADARLIFDNCYLFNPPGTPVYDMGQQVERAFAAEWDRLNQPAPDASADNPPEKPSPAAKRKQLLPAKDDAAAKKKPKKKRMSTGQRRASAAADAKGGSGAMDPSSMDPDALLALLDQPPRPGDWQALCRRVLLRLQAHPAALEFNAPVDPERQGVPTYREIVKQPMDLGTVRKQLDRHQYAGPEGVRDDILRVCSNCFLFNPPDTFVHNQGRELERLFARVWEQHTGYPPDHEPVAVPPDLPMDDARLERARAVVAQLKRAECAYPFLLPVDPVALGVPTYFDVVRNPMDLASVHKKLARRAYASVADFVADLQLILDDCFLFNLPDTPVNECGKALQTMVAELLKPDAWDRWLAAPGQE